MQINYLIFRKRKSGFTLAEVLITLGIIGIVATMTIPALILDSQKQEFTSLLRKQYTTLSQALILMSQDMGCSGDMACTGLFSSTLTTAQSLGDAIVPYLKVAQNCQCDTSAGCIPDVSIYYNGLGSRSRMNTGNAAYSILTIDGATVVFTISSTDCTSSVGTGIMSSTCGLVGIDVNGLKGPNNYGRDVFRFYITRSGTLYPMGGAFYAPGGNSKYWKDIGACQPSTASTVNGTFCTGRVMDEGWAMNY